MSKTIAACFANPLNLFTLPPESSQKICASTKNSIKTPIGNQTPMVSGEPDNKSKFISVKELAIKYGLNQAAVYGFIKSDPTFPYVNVGSKKKFLIEVTRFELWLENRTANEKRNHFAIPSDFELIAAFRNKNGGVRK